ncbi:MAG: sugar ABC transporter permease [Armatimonadetes bacterium]|nr:sugar ABC transporter permease [Armatimonadota bacterium]
MAPAVLLLLAISAYPIVFQFLLSFTNLNLAFPAEAQRYFGNYPRLLADPRFWSSGVVLVKLWLGGLALTMLLGTAIALAAFRATFARRLMPVLILPMVATPVVMAHFFQYLYSSDYGLIRFLLERVRLYPGFNISTQAGTVLYSLIVIDTWQWTPFVMLIVWAGLVSIPQELLDAVRVDGASGAATLWHLILPAVSGELAAAALFRTVEGLRAFVIIWGLTRGGPGTASEVTSIYIYNTAFRSLDLGYAAAQGMALLVFALAVSLLLLRVVARTRAQ